MQLSVVSQNLRPLVLILTLSEGLSRGCFLLLWLRDPLLDEFSLALAAIKDGHAGFLHWVRPLHTLGDVEFSTDTLFKLFERLLGKLMIALSLSDKGFYLSLNDGIYLWEIKVSVYSLGQEILYLCSWFVFSARRCAKARLWIVLAQSSSKVSHKVKE